MISEAPWVKLPVELNAANLFLLHRKLQTINPYVPSVRAGAKPKKRAATRASLLVQNLHKGHLDILSINVLQLLPADAAEELASTILAWCGWLLELMDRAGARRPYALTWRQAPSVDDGKPPLLGVGLAALAVLCFAVLDSSAKYLTQHYPVAMVVWARYAVHTVLMLLAFAPTRALLRRFKLFGPPGTLFFGPDGRERDALRVVGFVPAARFLQTLGAAGL